MKKAVVTGVTGQDGAYLSEFLLSNGYKVFGAFRRASSTNFWRLEELGIRNHPNLELLEFDLTDPGAAMRLMAKCEPAEVYNLAAQSFVGVSFEQPSTTAQITGIGVIHLLEAIRIVNTGIKFYQASTSEMFGLVQQVPQSETTPFYPRSPYGISKLFAHWSTINYRESFSIFGASGILFNHESPLRGKEFVTRKITDGVAQIASGRLECVELGNLDAERDWGFAKDYVIGMHAMLQREEPGTYVLATGRRASVRDFARMSFAAAGIEVVFEGVGVNECARDKEGVVRLCVNPAFYRPAEVDLLIGNPTLARNDLGWSAKTMLEDLCQLMVEADLRRVRGGFSW